MDRVNLLQKQWQFRVIGNLGIHYPDGIHIGLFKTGLQGNVVAHGRNAPIDGASTHRNQDPAVRPKLTKRFNILRIAKAALDQSNINHALTMLDIGQRAAIELSDLAKIEKSLVDIQK